MNRTALVCGAVCCVAIGFSITLAQSGTGIDSPAITACKEQLMTAHPTHPHVSGNESGEGEWFRQSIETRLPEITIHPNVERNPVVVLDERFCNESPVPVTQESSYTHEEQRGYTLLNGWEAAVEVDGSTGKLAKFVADLSLKVSGGFQYEHTSSWSVTETFSETSTYTIDSCHTFELMKIRVEMTSHGTYRSTEAVCTCWHHPSDDEIEHTCGAVVLDGAGKAWRQGHTTFGGGSIGEYPCECPPTFGLPGEGNP